MVAPAERRSVSKSRVAKAMPIESSVNGLPVGPITVARLRTQRPASGISAVMTMSVAPGALGDPVIGDVGAFGDDYPLDHVRCAARS